ncbi:MAG: hypothetical protein QM719_06580 [Thermomonas sp.]
MKISAVLLIIHLCTLSFTANADGGGHCEKNFSVTGKSDFTGLKPLRLKADERSSSEGADLLLFSDQNNKLAFILITSYGETGKRVALYEISDQQADSFSARVSNYAYMAPIYAGPLKVVSVNTSSFIVCDGRVLRGAGALEVSDGAIQQSKNEVARAVNAFNLSLHESKGR